MEEKRRRRRNRKRKRRGGREDKSMEEEEKEDVARSWREIWRSFLRERKHLAPTEGDVFRPHNVADYPLRLAARLLPNNRRMMTGLRQEADGADHGRCASGRPVLTESSQSQCFSASLVCVAVASSAKPDVTLCACDFRSFSLTLSIPPCPLALLSHGDNVPLIL